MSTDASRAATHYQQVALDAKLAADHPLDAGNLPTFTSSEIGVLRSHYPDLVPRRQNVNAPPWRVEDLRTAAIKDHREGEAGSVTMLIHEPSEWHLRNVSSRRERRV